MALAAMEMFVSDVTTENVGTLPINVAWSASMVAAGAADSRVPGGENSKPSLVRAFAQIDSYIATGRTKADAVANAGSASGPRHPVGAKRYYDFYANAGDFIAWSVA